MWASSLFVTEVFFWSEIIAPVERSLSDSVFITYFPVCQALPTFPEVFLFSSGMGLSVLSSDSHLAFLCPWVFSKLMIAIKRCLRARQVHTSSFSRRSFVFAFQKPQCRLHTQGTESPSVVRFPNQRIQIGATPSNFSCFLGIQLNLRSLTKGFPLGFGFQDCGSVSTYVKCPYGDTSTTRAFGGTSQFCGPESPIGKASPLRYFCVNDLLHFICKQGSIHSSYGLLRRALEPFLVPKFLARPIPFRPL